MLAANRTAKVNGRINALIISITTIKGTKAEGVPIGTRWAKNSLVFFKKEVKTNPAHTEKASGIVKDRWLEAVKTYGRSPIKLFRIIKHKMLTIIKLIDLLNPL